VAEFQTKGLIGLKGKLAMKTIPLTEKQISAVENYLIGTELSLCAALHACYIDADEPGYFADELDSVSQYYLEERIFKCALCGVWSRTFERAREAMRNSETPNCEICVMSPEDIFNSDLHFLRACGIGGDVQAITANFPLSPDIAGTPRPTDRLLVTDADLDFLSACGIRARLSPEDSARRELVTVGRKNR
jgi:hypothetical protein